MSTLNTVYLLGNLTKDPDLSYTPKGKPVCRISLAVSNKYKKETGEQVDDPLFIDCVIWNKPGEATAEYMKKGYQLFVIGRLHLDQWTDKNEVKHRKIKVIASKVIFGSKPGEKSTKLETTSPDRSVSDHPGSDQNAQE